jgi:hypothetical protein
MKIYIVAELYASTPTIQGVFTSKELAEECAGDHKDRGWECVVIEKVVRGKINDASPFDIDLFDFNGF